MYEILVDVLGDLTPSSFSGAEDILTLLDQLAIDEYKGDSFTQLAAVYDAGIGSGYLSFSESMLLLNDRISQTDIKSISFSSRENVPLLYIDAVSVTSGVDGLRYEKCIELMNVIAGADLLTELSVQDGSPQYLMLARQSPYEVLAGQ